MINPDTLFAISIALSFVAGIAFAVLLAGLLHRGAKQMEHTNDHAEQKAGEISATNKG